MGQAIAEPSEGDLDHLILSDDPVISAFTRWLVTEAGPDDWHRVASGWNWDAGEDPLWWIATRPDCDKATALMMLWKTAANHPTGDTGEDCADDDEHDLNQAIRSRWDSGFYVRSELSFDFRRDVYLSDLVACHRHFGDAVEMIMPPDMRQLEGRILETFGCVEGIPARFWDLAEEDDDFGEDETWEPEAEAADA
ncbi:MAG: DUF4274 domain-containing protein [Proteobacteria bacterium]|nr:DUF4274 domain-containing protein [Pseudomonadota bacterium]